MGLMAVAKEHKGFRIEVSYDERAESPREAWDNAGVMALFHRRYDLANEAGIDHRDFNGWPEMEAHIEKRLKAKIVLPVYMYDHSGVALNTTGFSCPWDSGRVGFIFITAERIRECFGVERITKAILERAKGSLEAEVETYSEYLNGSVYGFNIKDPDGEEIEDGSCWGFIGDFEKSGLMPEAIGHIERHIERKHKGLLPG